jgi:hypothetical protein
MANNVHTLAHDLPVLGRFDEFLKRGDAVTMLWSTGYEAAEGAINDQRRWLKRDQEMALLLPSLARDLAALQRQATRTEIVDALLPLNVLPSGKGAPANAGSVLAQRVAAREPSFGAVNIAALRVLDTATWYPVPSVLLEALDLAETTLGSIDHAIQKIPTWRDEVAGALAEAEQMQAIHSQRRAAQLARDNIAKRLADEADGTETADRR